MRIFVCLLVVLTSLLGHALGQAAVEMDASHFLSSDIQGLKLSRATFIEAVEQVRKAASTSELSAPEVRVVNYATPQNSEDFPFREDGEMVVSVNLTDVSAHEALETLCFACGYALDLKYGQVRCFQVPHIAPNPHVFLTEGPATSPSADLREAVLPSYKAVDMSFLDAVEMLRSAAAKASGKRVLPFVVVEYRQQTDARQDAHDINARTISLDLKKVPFGKCLQYVSELGGCTYRMSPGGAVSIRDVHTLYHPRYMRVGMLADFARAMKVKQSSLTEKSITEWLDKETDVGAVPVIHYPSGRVYFDLLHPHELSALQRLLSRK